MSIRNFILILITIILFSYSAKNKSLTSNSDIADSALIFAKKVLKENLRIRYHERAIKNYFDVQMIFETDDLISYTSYFDKRYQDKLEEGNYNGFILFVANYKNTKSAKYAFQELKNNTPIRLSELEGMAGLLVEQVQIFERIRKSGGIFTQKDKYVFYLVETCEKPPVGTNWREYENLFLDYITEKNERIEVINADCGKDEFTIQNLKTD